MAEFEVINIGDQANDGTGDSIRTAFEKINANFANVSAIGNLANVPFSFPGGVGSASQVLTSYGNGATYWNQISITDTINFISANASPAIDLSISNQIQITLGQDVTTSTTLNGITGVEYTFTIVQGGLGQNTAGNYAWTWPITFMGGGNISITNLNTAPGSFCTQKFVYNSLGTPYQFLATTPLLYVGS